MYAAMQAQTFCPPPSPRLIKCTYCDDYCTLVPSAAAATADPYGTNAAYHAQQQQPAVATAPAGMYATAMPMQMVSVPSEICFQLLRIQSRTSTAEAAVVSALHTMPLL